MKKERQTFARSCVECGAEYQAVLANSRFCSSSCRASYWRAAQRSETQQSAHETQKYTQEPADSLSPEVQHPRDNMLGLQFTVDLLRDQSDRWYSAFQEERTKRKILQEELAHAKQEPIRLKELHAFETLQTKKPDIVERMLAGIGNLPTPLLEQLAPLVGRLGNLVIPPQQSSPLSGISNETKPLIDWIQGLPEDVRNRVLVTLQKVSELPEIDMLKLLDEIHKYLEPRIRVMRPPTSGHSY